MSNKKTNKYNKKKGDVKLTHKEIRKGYAQFYHNKRKVLSGETYRSRKHTGPEKAPSRYKGRY